MDLFCPKKSWTVTLEMARGCRSFPCFFGLRIILDSKPNHPEHTVGGRNPAPVDMVHIPWFTRVLYIPGGCLGFLPSTVSLTKQRIVLYESLTISSGFPTPQPKNQKPKFRNPQWTSRVKSEHVTWRSDRLRPGPTSGEMIAGQLSCGDTN